jgi:hypothetical protein
MADKVEGSVESPEWDAKTDFAIGVPDDPDAIPTVRYQVLLGRVYVTSSWKDGSRACGEIPLDALSKLVGGPVTKEGWYDEGGNYLGQDPGLEQEEP